MYPTISNNAYYFAQEELEFESSSQPCPVDAPLVSQFEPFGQQPKPFPASYDCWEPSASYSTSWLDVPAESFEFGASQQDKLEQQQRPVSSLQMADGNLDRMQHSLMDLQMMELPGAAGIASTPSGIHTAGHNETAALGGVEPWCREVVTIHPIAPSRCESAVFSIDEPTVLGTHVPLSTRVAPNKKRSKGTGTLTTSPGPPVTIALPKPTGDPERDAFLARVYTTNATNGKLIQKLPVVGKIPLDLFGLHKQVAEHGGFEQVLKEKLWKPIALNLGISLKACTDYGFRLRRHYERFLLCIDVADRAGGTTTPPPPGKRSVPGTKKKVGSGGIVKRSSSKRSTGSRAAPKPATAKLPIRR